MNGKGSKRRAGDDPKAYRENYDRIFGKRKESSQVNAKLKDVIYGRLRDLNEGEKLFLNSAKSTTERYAIPVGSKRGKQNG